MNEPLKPEVRKRRRKVIFTFLVGPLILLALVALVISLG